MLTVTVLDHLREVSVEEDVLRDVARVRLLGPDWTREEAMRASDGLLLWHIGQLNAGDIGTMERARIIQRAGVGFDNVDLAAARARGIAVCNVPDYGTEDVADHTMAFMLALARGLWAYGRNVLEDPLTGWNWFKAGRANARLRGQRLGLIGMGRIGSAVALRARVFGLHVTVFDPYVGDGYEKALGVERVRSLRELAGCDIISIHAPLTPETRGMIDRAFWSASDRPAVLINTARGPIVHEEDLCDAYRRGRVVGIGVDVLQEEPLRPTGALGHLMETMPEATRDIIVTPHAAFFSPQAYEELRRKAAENVRRCFVDGSHRNLVA